MLLTSGTTVKELTRDETTIAGLSAALYGASGKHPFVGEVQGDRGDLGPAGEGHGSIG